jgi:hypothetical protein
MEKENGVYIGVSKTNAKPVLFNPFECNTYQNGPTFGKLGVGKQFEMKEIVRVDINNRIANPLDNENVIEKNFLEQGYAVCDIKDYTEQEEAELLNYISKFYSPEN